MVLLVCFHESLDGSAAADDLLDDFAAELHFVNDLDRLDVEVICAVVLRHHFIELLRYFLHDLSTQHRGDVTNPGWFLLRKHNHIT